MIFFLFQKTDHRPNFTAMPPKKRCKLFKDEGLQPSTSIAHHHNVDWTLCALCQEPSSQPLHCPALSKRKDIGAGYDTLGDNLEKFKSLGIQPIAVDIADLNDGDGISQTLAKNSAKWHSSCRLKCSASRLSRLQSAPTSDTRSDPRNVPFTRRPDALNVEPAHSAKCFFCDEVATEKTPLHDVMTANVTYRVKKCAIKLQDKKLLAKLSPGDLVAQDAKYHARCLVKLYNDANRAIKEENQKENTDGVLHGIALAELLSYIEESKMTDNSVATIFKLSNLVKLYSGRLRELGVDVTGRIHSSHLKDRILANLPGIRAYRQGREVVLSFDDDVGLALMNSCLSNFDDDGICLGKAAEIIRRDIMSMQSAFDGSFASGCQEASVPKSLVALVSMIIEGTSITNKNTDENRQSTLSMAQLLQYNSCVKPRTGSSRTRHSRNRETPLPLYLGMMIHAHTRKRELVDSLFHLGLSVSYDRVMDVSMDMGTAAGNQYEKDGVVCPLILRKGLFTTAAVDNIDYNPSSNTAHDAFHGTGISLFQNRKDQSDGIKRERAILQPGTSNKKLPQLPESYTNVTQVTVRNKDPAVPLMTGVLTSSSSALNAALEEEKKWQNNTQRLVLEEAQTIEDPIAWAAFHSSAQPQRNFDVSIASLLPLFSDDSKSVAMIRHSMDVIKRSVEHLNPGQVPVITVDQPLFAIAKSIQWNWPESYGENKFVVLLGGLHIEMAALATLGDLLNGSGWTNALTQAGIATAGMSDSFLKGAHVKRTRHAHQVTSSALSILLHAAYDSYVLGTNAPMTLDDWIVKQEEAYPQFKYWYMVMHLESLLLVYVRSLREGNFMLYINALQALAPWFFALDHTHYSRWVPVHIRDMATLHERLPEVAKEFDQGSFVVHKSTRPFSAIAIDHAHEQNNVLVKGDGGAIGLMQNPRALLRWMVAGPEIAMAIRSFETSCLQHDTGRRNGRHHEHTAAVQVAFAKEVRALVNVIEDLGNPFMEWSGDLLVLDTRDIAEPAVVATVRGIQKIGQDQYDSYVTDRLVDRTSPVSYPISKNNLALFSTPAKRTPSKGTQMLTSLKSDCSLFSRLYIACQTRDGDLENFFRHENHAYPPSLSQLGQLRIGTKADLTHCLEELCTSQGEAPAVDVIILDGAAIVNMMKPVGVKTFQEYATIVFLPYIKAQLANVKRLDIVWDVYRPDSLKSTTRVKRGKGVRRRVAATHSIPGNWQEFLRVNDNKTELFEFLAHQVVDNVSAEREVYSTCGDHVLCSCVDQDVSALAPCSHEEADTRILLHAMDAVEKGYRQIMLRTVDTDVVVLAVSTVVLLENTQLWIAFGTGKHLRYIPAHQIATSLGAEKARALPMFHAFTGCDTVSSFAGKGKKTAFDSWKSFDAVTEVFARLVTRPGSFDEDCMSILESYVVYMYDRGSAETTVNSARKQMFTCKGRSFDTIPPTRAALLQHAKRATYQGGHVWGQTHVRDPDLPSPELWGWSTNPKLGWTPIWTLLPEAAMSCSELLRCGCKKECRGLCKCVRAHLKCTSLCHCSGNCEHNDSY